MCDSSPESLISMLPLATINRMDDYRAQARKRQQRKRDRLEEQYQLGLKVAEQAASLLKHEFQAEKVVLFGSMLSLSRLHERSDLDLAVWGLNPEDYYRAVGCLLALDSRIQIDLVQVELASPRILQEIETTGVLL